MGLVGWILLVGLGFVDLWFWKSEFETRVSLEVPLWKQSVISLGESDLGVSGLVVRGGGTVEENFIEIELCAGRLHVQVNIATHLTLSRPDC